MVRSSQRKYNHYLEFDFREGPAHNKDKFCFDAMNGPDPIREDGLVPDIESAGSNPAESPSGRSNAFRFTNKLTSVLSGLYVDSDIRDALSVLDDRRLRNDAETRRRLRLETQKQVIDGNGYVVQDFSKVAEVGCLPNWRRIHGDC